MAKKTTKTVKKGQMSKEQPNFFKAVNTLLSDQRFKYLMGITIVVFTAYLALAFVSYLFTWKHDQDIVERGLTNSHAVVENWASRFGAYMSSVFIHDWFGIASFAFLFIFILWGFRLMKVTLLPFWLSLKYTCLGVVWVSLTLGFIFGDSYFYLGGAHGIVMSSWFSSMIGNIGTAFIILISLFAFIIFTFENSLDKLVDFVKKLSSISVKNKIMPNVNLNLKSTLIEKISKQTSNTDNQDKTDAKHNSNIKQNVNADDSKKVLLSTDIIDDPNDDFGGNFKTQNKANTDVKGAVVKKEFYLGDDGKEYNQMELDLEVEKVQDEEKIEESQISQNTQNAENNPVSDSTQAVPTVNSGGIAILVEKNEDVVNENFEYKIENYDPTLELSRYMFPPLDLLEDHRSENSDVTNEELISNKNKIVETLKNYKIEIQKIKASIGPTITLYEIIPAPGVRISKIKNLEDDIALSLAALGIRIIAPMPGRGTVGIEVPNQKPEIVSMRSVIASKRFQESKYELPIAIGKNISNETYVFDLAKMPHLLVAGATGQGKSVGLNAILTSILYKKHPSQVKFVLIDPKKVELNIYEKIERHYLAKLPDAEESIITDNQKVVYTLASLNIEMDNRYNLLKKAMVRNIAEYNEKFIKRRLNPENGHRFLPYIIVVIDEFADLIMTAGKEVEMPLARLAQLARAIGIHLIVATQRPSTNIITGVIKANFPARLAFRVASMMDSRTILDSPGANQLIGRGDMLITQGSDLIRLQCAFVDTAEIDKITDFIGAQKGYPSPYLLPEYEGAEATDEEQSVDLSKKDELFEEAARIVVTHQQGSTSLIQRKLSIGYNRAGRIVDQLEAAGIVGPFEGSKARSVLYHDIVALQEYLDIIK